MTESNGRYLEISTYPIFDDGDFYYKTVVFDRHRDDPGSREVRDIFHSVDLDQVIATLEEWYGTQEGKRGTGKPVVSISKQEVDDTLTRLGKAVALYSEIQSSFERQRDNQRLDDDFRRKYVRFYRMRRPIAWRNDFFRFLHSLRDKDVNFKVVLDHLGKDRLEASFASKLIATLDPSMPVLDSIVLKRVGVRLPHLKANDRREKVCSLIDDLKQEYERFLGTEEGRYAVTAFRSAFQSASVSDVKIVDLLLWQGGRT